MCNRSKFLPQLIAEKGSFNVGGVQVKEKGCMKVQNVKSKKKIVQMNKAESQLLCGY